MVARGYFISKFTRGCNREQFELFRSGFTRFFIIMLRVVDVARFTRLRKVDRYKRRQRSRPRCVGVFGRVINCSSNRSDKCHNIVIFSKMKSFYTLFRILVTTPTFSGIAEWDLREFIKPSNKMLGKRNLSIRRTRINSNHR